MKSTSFLSSRNISLFVFWTSLVLVSLLLQTLHREEDVKKLAVIEANTAFHKDSAIRMWVANHGGIYVLSNEQTPPNPYLSHVPDRDIVTPSGKKLTLVNAAYLMRQLLESASNQAGSKSKVTSLKPLNPINKPDSWEREALIKLEEGEEEVMEFTKGDDGFHLRLIRPFSITKACFYCHREQGFKVGDVGGGLSITVDMAPYWRIKEHENREIYILHGSLWVLGVAAIGVWWRESEKRFQLRQMTKKKLEFARQEMIAAQKLSAIGQLAAGVSHEVLNPVNIISVQAQMLQRKNQDNPKIQEFYFKLKTEIDRIVKIMTSILEFSRKGDAKLEKGFLRKEIENVLSIVEEEYKLDNIKIVKNWCGEKVHVLYDSDKMRQVFLNLLQNAKHALPKGGTITISCKTIEKDGQQFHQFRVSDTGTGMSDETRQKVFDPFFTTKPEGEGTGMGLSVVHGIIEEHGGEISVESEEGRGTIFFIDLPIVVDG